MAKFKVNNNFKGKKEGKSFKAGEEHDFTVERADEINDLLGKNYGLKNTLERVNPPKKQKKTDDE